MKLTREIVRLIQQAMKDPDETARLCVIIYTVTTMIYVLRQ